MTASYFVGRLGQGILTVFAVIALVFVLVRISGDIVVIMAPLDATSSDLARTRHELGLDKPVPVQFVNYVGRALRGDLGISPRNRLPAMELVRDRLPATAELAGASLLIAIGIGIPIGVLTAIQRGSWVDGIGKVFALLGQAVPSFWFGIVLILFLSVDLRLFPSGGRHGLRGFVLPAVALGWSSVASILRLTRSAMLDVMDEDYIVFARARGLGERRIVWKHGLRNALLPVITIIGVQLGFLLGGSVTIESVFAWPGVGKLLVDAILQRDYAVVQAAVLVSATVFVGLNVFVDMCYSIVDPRVRVR